MWVVSNQIDLIDAAPKSIDFRLRASSRYRARMKSITGSKEELVRRPIKARNTAWAAAVARWLGLIGLRPNHISVLSVVFAALAALCLALVTATTPLPKFLLWFAAAAFIQLRLLCNLFDGMVAVEGGFRTRSGEIYNELPDRISDALVLVSAGCAANRFGWEHTLGWTAALLSVMTAYVRTLGAQAGARQHFCGPMAKQQRMFLVTGACLIAPFLSGTGQAAALMTVVLGLVAGGCVVTVIRRTMLVVRELEANGAALPRSISNSND